MIAPESTAELTEAVRSLPRLLAVGALTKPRLSAVDVPKLSTARLSGILEYDPSEFTFTALAGTPMREIATALAERGQYLPFDPFLLDAGSTLGGTVASGLSGPGRFRYGGVRDFILGVRFVDGSGRLLRMGGKVVKNAAGFDLPKFFVGSLGRYGILAECTFKVFPRAPATRSLKISFDAIEDAAQILTAAANTRWEPDALDILPDGRSLLIRLAAPEPALDAVSREILGRWSGTRLPPEEAAAAWASLREFQWAPADHPLLKVPLTPAQIPQLYRALKDARIHVSSGGNAAYVSTNAALPAEGLLLRGEGRLFCTARKDLQIARAVKEALDPQQRFPSLNDD